MDARLTLIQQKLGAADPAFLAQVKRDIAAGIASSVFTDMPAHTRNLESAYRSAIGTWTEG